MTGPARGPLGRAVELDVAVLPAAREVVACELPQLTFDGPLRSAFAHCAPVVRTRR
ncbi:MAG: hypothetical protein L6Q99_08715 [Planctomycetes bacterium]|nr:hypothetical protein [Planctomycetota bacterium]